MKDRKEIIQAKYDESYDEMSFQKGFPLTDYEEEKLWEEIEIEFSVNEMEEAISKCEGME